MISYEYTSGSLFSSISYTYGTDGWKDQLTAYGTDTISYDDISNPLSDGTWTYTWAQGRQLQSMVRTLDSYSLTYSSPKEDKKSIWNYIISAAVVIAAIASPIPGDEVVAATAFTMLFQ
ncbi:MAG: hypothetical protein IJK59_01995 [Firmicutes bacterium]|nr:hypothetical protein [Bacillota bacterium]MBQ7185127.1 hypothetical protein [Clostridia bacterium]